MANRLRGEASFVDAGRTLVMVLDSEALLQVEDLTGIGLFELDRGLKRLGVLAALLMAGVKSGCEISLSRSEAADLLLANDAAREAVMTALERALPDSEAPSGSAEKNPTKAARNKAGTGKKP